MEKVGIFGGSFDPPHLGHKRIAEQILEKKIVDKIFFMPAFVQPFKQTEAVTDFMKRLQMTALLTKDNDKLFVLDYEIKKKGISYTYETLSELKKTQFMGSEMYFIQGEDTFKEILKWHKSDNLLQEFSFIVARRKGTENSIQDFIKDLTKKYDCNIHLLDNEYIDVSSTEIRSLIKENFLTDEIYDYIKKNKLYGY